MRVILIIIILFSLSGCILGKRLSKPNFVNGWYVRHTLLYNNRTASHIPVKIATVAFLKETQTTFMYEFYLNSDTVKKYSYPLRRSNGTIYFLAFDSNRLDKKQNKDFIAISKLESDIFDKIIHISDSMHLKNFNYLKQGVAFISMKEK